MVGSGVLGLPYTFSRTGWAAGSILLLAVAGLTFHCIMLLVGCRRRVPVPSGIPLVYVKRRLVILYYVTEGVLYRRL